MAKAKQQPKYERRPIDFTSPGRMMNGTKRGPEGHICVFNANVCVKSKGKIWFGDLDLMTPDADDLKALAAQHGEDVFILREYDARFETQSTPRYENAVAVVTPTGELTINK